MTASASQHRSTRTKSPSRGHFPARQRAGGSALFAGIVLFCFVLPPLMGQQRAYMAPPDAGSGAAHMETGSRHFRLSREGLVLANRTGSTQIRVHGYLQADGRFFRQDMKDRSRDVLLFRRIRPLVEGSLGSRIEFRFMPDFGQANPVVQEVYLDWTPARFASIRAGKFKAPLGLEALRSDRALTFPERSLASDFMPVRDLGVQFEGSIGRDRLTYQLGYFSGAEDGTNSKFEWRGTNEGDARLFLQPLASTAAHLRQIGLGISGSVNERRTQLPSFKTVGQETFFKYASKASAEGFHYRVSPQGFYYRGSLGILSEFVLSRGGVAAARQQRNLNNTGWQLAGSYVLTGEKNGYGGVEPSRSFSMQHLRSHPGAWELAVRHSEGRIDPHTFPMYADPATSARAALESAAGLNWYLNPSLKLMSFYEHTAFRSAEKAVVPRKSEDVAVLRLQLAF